MFPSKYLFFHKSCNLLLWFCLIFEKIIIMKIANLYLQKLKNNELTDFTLLGTQSMSPPFLD